ncbi:MAG: SDR family oxidoreductase [Proteobacteria bacterium]|jgi:3-oxoacyl-[acyl-carrier protein] reductase|nr:SDR family oxidoreductase [Pseudomonadota bacterium]
MELAERHALVCGASKGIGRAAARAMAAQGASLTLVARTESLLQEAKDEALHLGATQATYVVADLDDRHEMLRSLRGHLADRAVHIVVNNTGGPPAGPLLEASESAMLSAFSRHLFAAHGLMQLVLPGMISAQYGRFIQVLSISVREPIPNLGVSNMVRAAMAAWAKSLSRELPRGITINNVLPGYTDTGRLRELAEDIAERTGQTVGEVQAGWTALTPEERLGRPEEIGEVIAFLASKRASFVRGVSLPVDGGRLFSI